MTGSGSSRGGGGTRSGCGGKGTWLFRKCSGVDGSELGGEDGASVGEVATSELSDEGSWAGSKSRSGMGGESSGRRVMRRMSKRRVALGG